MLTETQLNQRAGKMTSSVVAGALGLNPNMTPTAAREAILRVSDFTGNKATERGNLLEEPILEFPCRALGLIRGEVGFAQIEPWAGDSVDAIYYQAGAVVAIGEGKSVALGSREKWGTPGTDQVPAHVAVQCYWHLIHWPDAEYCVVPVLFGGYEFQFELYIIRRDEAIQAELWARAKDWYERFILGDEVPEIAAGDTEWLSRRFPCDLGTELECTPDFEEVAAEVVALNEERKAIEEREEAAKNRLRFLLGTHTTCRGPRFSATWKNSKDSIVVDYKGLVDALNISRETIDAFTTSKPGARVLRVTASKGARK
jgi:hypothetical protein